MRECNNDGKRGNHRSFFNNAGYKKSIDELLEIFVLLLLLLLCHLIDVGCPKIEN